MPKLSPPKATHSQILKLLLMLETAGEIHRDHKSDDIFDYESDGLHWVRDFMGIEVDRLSNLTNDQIHRCYEEIG